MSTSLVENYESEEEFQPVLIEDSDEETEEVVENPHDEDDDIGDLNGPATTLAALVAPRREKAPTSSLPSVADAFTEVSECRCPSKLLRKLGRMIHMDRQRNRKHVLLFETYNVSAF